jgi:DNA-directed RNA polymerase subunit RPC12/RpoP
MEEYEQRSYHCAICGKSAGMAIDSRRESSLICEDCRMKLIEDLSGNKGWMKEGTEMTEVGKRVMAFVELIGHIGLAVLKVEVE